MEEELSEITKNDDVDIDDPQPHTLTLKYIVSIYTSRRGLNHFKTTVS